MLNVWRMLRSFETFWLLVVCATVCSVGEFVQSVQYKRKRIKRVSLRRLNVIYLEEVKITVLTRLSEPHHKYLLKLYMYSGCIHEMMDLVSLLR